MNTLLIGDNIKKLRQFKGIKQEQLAKELNITRSTLSRLENGKGDYNLPLVRKIALTLQVNMSSLVSAKLSTYNDYQLHAFAEI